MGAGADLARRLRGATPSLGDEAITPTAQGPVIRAPGAGSVRDVDAQGRPVPDQWIGPIDDLRNPPGKGAYLSRAIRGMGRGVEDLVKAPIDILDAVWPGATPNESGPQAKLYDRNRDREARAANDESPGRTDIYEALGGELPFAAAGITTSAVRGAAVPKTGLIRRAVGRGTLERAGEQFVRSKGTAIAEELASSLGSVAGQQSMEGSPIGESVGAVVGGVVAPRSVSLATDAARTLATRSVRGYTKGQTRAALDTLGEAASDPHAAARSAIEQTPAGGTVYSSAGDPRVGDRGLQGLESSLSQDSRFNQEAALRRSQGLEARGREVQALGGTGDPANAQIALSNQQEGIANRYEEGHARRVQEHERTVAGAQRKAEAAADAIGLRPGSAAASKVLQDELIVAKNEVLKPIGAKFDDLARRADEAGVKLNTQPLVDALGSVAETTDWNKVLESLPPSVRRKVESTIQFEKKVKLYGAGGEDLLIPQRPKPISWTEMRALQQRIGEALGDATEPSVRRDMNKIRDGIDASFDSSGGALSGELKAVRGEYADASSVFRTGQMDDALQPNARRRDASEDVVGELWRGDRQKGALEEAARLRRAIDIKPGLRPAAEAAILAHAYDFAADPVTRQIKHDRLMRYVNTHKKALSQFPDTEAKLLGARGPTRTFEELQKAGAPRRLDMQRSVLSQYVDNPRAKVGQIVSQNDGRALGDLMQRVRGDEDALAGLRREVFDRVIGSEDALPSSSNLRRALEKHRGLIAQTFGDEHVANLERISREMDRFERIPTKLPRVDPGTGQTTRVPGWVSVWVERIGSVAWKAKREVELSRAVSAQLVDEKVVQLLSQANFDPELAARLLADTTPANERKLRRYLTVTGLLTNVRNVADPFVETRGERRNETLSQENTQ